MKIKYFVSAFCVILVAEIIALTVFAVRTPDFSQDTVAVNEIVNTVARDFDSLETHKNPTALDYVVIADDETVLFRTRHGLSESINAAIAHRDTVVDVTIGGAVACKVIIYNDGAKALQSQKQTAITVIAVAIAVECVLIAAYCIFMHSTFVRPFRKLKGFAERVAGGNLDIPLEMDKRNLFGAFTESFDIMRSELKKARLAEMQAQNSKKELVAKLSHDIKTPVASIKAVSEVGLAVTESARDRESFERIISKSDEINSLVNNLFTATLEELHRLDVTPVRIDGGRVQTVLKNADYLNRAEIPALPRCCVYADALRLQQVFDNIFANSYKYANTDIAVGAWSDAGNLYITIEDFGGGVSAEDLPVLKEKFRRGSNAGNRDGAGLGLFISDYFMTEMDGVLNIENGEHGLKATVALRLCENN